MNIRMFEETIKNCEKKNSKNKTKNTKKMIKGWTKSLIERPKWLFESKTRKNYKVFDSVSLF